MPDRCFLSATLFMTLQFSPLIKFANRYFSVKFNEGSKLYIDAMIRIFAENTVWKASKFFNEILSLGEYKLTFLTGSQMDCYI